MPYSEFGEILSQVIFYYTFAHSETTPDEVLQKISELSQSKSNYMSTLQQMFIKSNADGEAKGEARGKAEGEARGKQLAAKILKLYLKGAKAAAIAAQLELALEFVEQTIADYEAA